MPKLTDLIRLARPHQWAKGVFVLIGPLYGLRALEPGGLPRVALHAAVAFIIFGLVSSACYIVNDILDADADRNHPRKSRRPIPSGSVSIAHARALAVVLLAAAAGLHPLLDRSVAPWVALFVSLYGFNVLAYSFSLKHHVVLDVMSLSAGFVLRVFGGCAAAAISPSTWLLNVTLFLAMFLAFGKRLGERRTLGSAENAASARAVQKIYTDDILRMVVVVTGVISLVTYAEYVQSQSESFAIALGAMTMNPLWFTMLPATYGLLRCIVLLEDGRYDDPTELAVSDRPFQVAAVLFVILTAASFWPVLVKPH